MSAKPMYIALRDLMTAYERIVRSNCTTPEQLEAKPWRCAEYVQAEDSIREWWLRRADSEPDFDSCLNCGRIVLAGKCCDAPRFPAPRPSGETAEPTRELDRENGTGCFRCGCPIVWPWAVPGHPDARFCGVGCHDAFTRAAAPAGPSGGEARKQ